jgi:RNA polymerase sigma-70 factor (ECF subfamily)
MDDTHRGSDRDLVEAVLARRPEAFERLIREYQGLCWHIVQRMVRNPDDARELCQDTFLRVYQCLHQYRFDSALKTWIGRVAYNIALRHLEHKRIPLVQHSNEGDDYVAIDHVSDGVDLEAAHTKDEIAKLLHAAIESLPPLQRTVLTLYHLEEIPLAEIALVTGLAIGTIKSHLFRSRLRLRVVLETLKGVAP